MDLVYVETLYTFSAVEPVEFPEGKSWDDVESYYVRWGDLHVFWKDGSQWMTHLEGPTLENVDWKRPDEVTVYASDTQGSPDFEHKIGGDNAPIQEAPA
jgi:hypothetical protein